MSENNRVKAIESLGDKVFDKALEIDADEAVQVGTGEKRKRDQLYDAEEKLMSATQRMKKRFIFNNQKSSAILSIFDMKISLCFYFVYGRLQFSSTKLT